MMDVENLDEKQDYKELPDTYVIFITENDYYKAGKSIFLIQSFQNRGKELYHIPVSFNSKLYF